MQPLVAQSDHAKAITNAIGVFIGADMRPYSVVQNEGFKHMLKVLEPRYDIPLRTHFSEKIVPDLYEQEKKKVVDELSRASSVALTTDGWTSRGTESYSRGHSDCKEVHTLPRQCRHPGLFEKEFEIISSGMLCFLSFILL